MEIPRKIVIITGASAGIGEVTARKFADFDAKTERRDSI
jgi:NADP-dependent 3-hydroxy acid dehydrogenase YdfG